MTIEKKQRVLICCLLSGLAIGAIAKFLLLDLWSQFTSLRHDILAQEVHLKKNLALRKARDRILEDYASVQVYYQLSSDDEKQMFAALLKEIERIAHSFAGTIVQLTPQDAPERMNNYKKYKVNFRLELNYPQLVQFIYEIQRSQWLIKLEKLSIVTNNDNDAQSMLRVEGIIVLAVLP